MNLKERFRINKSPSFLERPRIDKSSLDVHQVIAEFVKQEMIKMFEPVTAEVIKSLNVERIKKSVTPVKGKDYVDGETPTDNELRSLIRPLIPEVKDGETPTKEELLKLIRPLIPKVKDGETPSEARLSRIIKSLIPEPIKGKDGSSDTAKQVVDKTNEVGGVLIKSVENLSEELANLKKRPIQTQIKSGGKGNPQHEQFDGNGVTTSFTLGYNVAARGTAVFGCRYQGQTLYLNDQYTISGKTLTMVGFTPEDGTKIEITYIRV